jgi:hypothetical protein
MQDSLPGEAAIKIQAGLLSKALGTGASAAG